MTRVQVPPLHQLARLYGVQTAYYDVVHRRRQASPEALLSVLQAMGAPVQGWGDIPNALREGRQERWQRPLDPVVVAWAGEPTTVELRVPREWTPGRLVCHLQLEEGEARTWTCDLAPLTTLRATEVDGRVYLTKSLPLPSALPWGYHELSVETQNTVDHALVIAAPLKAYGAGKGPMNRRWGVFLPLYALHSQRSWGCGDFSDLDALGEWVAGLGGSVVATLPLLATFLDDPFDPSPYMPISRLFWNELYIDVDRVPELSRCPEAQVLLDSPEMRGEIASLRSTPLVDYFRQMALKRKILEKLAQCFFAEASEASSLLRRFVEARPEVEDYARFRAAGERQQAPWPQWPRPLRDGLIIPGDYNEEVARYHLYVQWLAHQQLEAVAEKARQRGQALYLDLPLGAHPDGYDVWRERSAFAGDVSAGAPPDRFFSKGQDWGFPPLHPQRIREQRYRYFIASLRHNLRFAGLCRLDHVMALHRLFWIPKGLEARQGVYVRYPTEELYAILSLESHRHGALIVGEDLGTVPSYVRPTMTRHGLRGMYVMQDELATNPHRPPRPVPAAAVVSLNTHDMHPFAGFWQGLDIENRQQRGLLDDTGAQAETETRHAIRQTLAGLLERHNWLDGSPGDVLAILKACLSHLSATPGQILLVNLEDLWLESQTQNIPGTGWEGINWQRKARHRFEVFCQMPQVFDTLRNIDHIRKGGATQRGAEKSS